MGDMASVPAVATATAAAQVVQKQCMLSAADRVKGALYGLLIADALAMPSHWYYGGESQVAQAYGTIKGYVKPETRLPGSIMSKSNTGGGGRGGYSGDVIGTLIFHGKKKFWARGADYHYHHALKAGDNPLEPLLVRRVVNVTAAAGGVFDEDQVRNDYINFMQTEDSHNDTYCGTCHRMFFANLASGKAPKDCPDNDGHNVDNSDSIITTVPVALLNSDEEKASDNAAAMVRITRKSQASEAYTRLFTNMLRSVVRGEHVDTVVQRAAKQLKMNLPNRGLDPVTA